ncbi:SDR family oxidoreductase [Pedobacter frigoris]|uniref:SDR family oxidoreductase n=1 Tax=Pedobacter frigoris TaxID=2571272 RepID=A0A4U1CPV0_9SPHI|nr:SDR family oxidoreductase [Pedobacter frigoris]TKC07515.1 SDR family oxidoreductase [Pedobacter frigoris]
MKNKVVWITGASSGIGEALVYAYDKAGARLIISSRNRDELYRVKMACKSPVNIHVLPIDLENTAALTDKAADAIKIYGTIDLLINSGGISQRGLALEIGLQTEQRLMNVNFWGTVILSKAVLPVMIKNGGGTIVCISSLVGKFGTRMRSAYSASKHALHGYFDSLRSEVFDKNIQITIICPGFIKTNVTLNALTATGEAQGTMDIAQENGMLPEECAMQIINAIKSKKEEVYIGGKEVKGVLFKRLFPLRFSKYLRTAKVT